MTTFCDCCGQPIYEEDKEICYGGHIFCCRECLNDFLDELADEDKEYLFWSEMDLGGEYEDWCTAHEDDNWD